ncbi:exodeoxyribonuclease VII large subunit [Microbacterium arborescens]|nr:exodeoxyribonuclease VII large subunit [Microbacterium arborescens]
MPSFETAPDQTPPPDAVHPRDSSPQTPTSISRLNETIRDFVQRWNAVWVEGEITSWNLRGGHVFGRLKDAEADAALSFRLWSSTLQRLGSSPQVGDRVVACVKSDYFVKSGDFSFTVSAMRPTGLGDQLVQLERLRAKLRAEGLFDASRKKTLPFLPHTIGLITGERSDAERDVHRNAELRWPHVAFRTVHAAVQGDRCVPETIAALRTLDADPEVDVIVIARGGGDPQTLLGFSDERLLRAVAAATTPVVSAIGHENDHPLLDDVADLRASTPTDAAKRVVPDVVEQRALVEQLRSPRPHATDPARLARSRAARAAALSTGAAQPGIAHDDPCPRTPRPHGARSRRRDAPHGRRGPRRGPAPRDSSGAVSGRHARPRLRDRASRRGSHHPRCRAGPGGRARHRHRRPRCLRGAVRGHRRRRGRAR